MNVRRTIRRVSGWAAAAVAMAAAGYGALLARSWLGYGRPRPPTRHEADALLDDLMPVYEVAERHRIYVKASPEATLAAAIATDMQQSAIIRSIFRLRDFVLGASASGPRRSVGLLAEVEALGWRMLAEAPGREIVMGAVTQPWLADVHFRGLSPAEFRAFSEPDYVKIAWTLRADPVGPSASIFRTETRVMTTDAAARRKFRWYWARFSPGIVVIRRLLIRVLKREAERRLVHTSQANRPTHADTTVAPR